MVEKLCLLSVYDYNLLESVIDDKELLLLVNKYHQVLKNKSDGNLIAELVAIVRIYYSNNETFDSINKLEIVNKDIRKQFLSFIKRGELIEKVVLLSDNGIVNKSVENSPAEDTLNELNLTKREKEVLNEVIKGLSNKEVAEVLYISDHTVKNHLTNILES